MPGCNVSAKRLSLDRGNIDALRHNWKPLLRAGKETGRRERRPCHHEKFVSFKRPASRRRAVAGRQAKRKVGSALELVEKVDRACCEHAEQCDTHCHCEIHYALLSRSRPVF
jgi:hypothetical protein